MSFSEMNTNGITPSFISLALSGITHRFILILECESRQSADGSPQINHPRFCVGGQRATLDPRNVSITELLPLATSKVDLPQGWEKVHQLIYVVQQNTDEHGWQYRSSWPRFALESSDEAWSGTNGPRADVRRRLWMTTVVKRDEIIAAKRKIADLIHSRHRGVILSGPLLRLEENEAQGKSWTVRNCTLADEKMELFDEQTNEKVGELPVMGNHVKMLDGFSFSVRSPDGKSCTIFDADSRETRRRWLVAMTYQLAVRDAMLDYVPFPYAPPLGEDASSRTVICGDLLKKGQTGMNWKSRFFKLTPRELQYYDKDMLKGSIKVEGAILKSDERTNDITVKSKSGVTIAVRAHGAENRAIWVKAMEEQIYLIEQKVANAAMAMSAEDHALTMKDDGAVGIIEIPSVAVKDAQNDVPATDDDHPLMSAFHARNAPPESPAVRRPTVIAVTSTPPTIERPRPVVIDEPASAPLTSSTSLHEFVNDDDAPDVEDEEDEEEEDEEEDAQASALDQTAGGSSSSSTRGKQAGTDVATKTRKLKFGLQPDVFICAEDFGVEPELLTTAQKVAILESQAFQNKNFNPILPPAPSAAKTSSMRNLPPTLPKVASFRADSTDSAGADVPAGSYVPTGLRMKTETLDAAAQDVSNDGGPVAKWTDKLSDKISKWEGWSKDINTHSPVKR